MIPYIHIAICALVGLIGWGIEGAIVGMIIGWVTAKLVGLAAFWKDKGILPKEVRRKAALEFMVKFEDTVIAAYPHGLEPEAVCKAIEGEIERIFRGAMESSGMQDTGLELHLVRSAGEKIIREETRPVRCELMAKLLS